MNKNILWALVVKNSIAIISWVVLAIVFNKWWIALFSALFLSGIQTQYRSFRICDKCGKHGPYADNRDEALKKAKESGWIHDVERNRDYCPDCQ